MKRGWFLLVLCMLLLLPQTPAMAGIPESTDLSDNTVGYDTEVLVDTDIRITGGDAYRGGSISFFITSSSIYDNLSFRSDDNTDATGALSIANGLLYLGNGSGRDIIGTVDALENGVFGNSYTLHFNRTLTNQGFENGDTTGWTRHESEYTDLDLNGRSIDYFFNSGATTGTGSIISPGVYFGFWPINQPSYDVETATDDVSEGTYALFLSNNARIIGTATNIDQPDGNGSMQGPYVVSDTFEASANDILSFDWKAQTVADAYEFFVFLIDEDGTRTERFSQRGDTQAWTTTDVYIPESGSYRIEFVCGSYDKTGNIRVGSELYVDNIRLTPHVNPADDVLTNIARHITYENTNSSGPDEAIRIFNVTVTAGDGNVASSSAELTLSTREGSDPFITVNTDLSLSQGESITLDTTILDAADPDSPDEALIFSVTTAPAHGQLQLSGTATDTFSREDLDSGRVDYVHDGTASSSDTIVFRVSDGTNQITDIQVAITISIPNIPPEITNNGMTLEEGTTRTLTTDMLNADDDDSSADTLIFTIDPAPAHGELRQNGMVVSTFTQQDLMSNTLVYIHDGSETLSDAFGFSLRDGSNTQDELTFSITITPRDDPPSVSVETLTINVGDSPTISSTYLSITDNDTADADLNITVVSGLLQGHLENTEDTSSPITSFTQADLAHGLIMYVHTETEAGTDSFGFVVEDATNVVANQLFSITINALPLPILTTTEASDISVTSLTTGGAISDQGGSDLRERGVCWGTASEPDITGSCTEDGTATGSFTSQITGLAPGTTYYIRAYATNDYGTAYGNEIAATTLSATPDAGPASGITATEFTANWNAITGVDGYRLDVSRDSNFSDFIDGFEDRPVTETSETVSGLVPGMTYHYRVRSEIGGVQSPNSDGVFVTLSGNSWIGGTGDWSDTTLWSRGTVPEADENVYIGTNVPLGAITITVSETAATDDLTLDGTFEGTLSCGSAAVTIGGDLTLSGGTFMATSATLTLGGNLNENGVTFVHNSGTVVLDGIGQALSGSLVFHDLTRQTVSSDTLYLAPDSRITVEGALTLSCTGTEGDLLVVDATATGTRPILEPLADVILDQVNVTENVTVIPAVSLMPSVTPALLSEGDTLDVTAELNMAGTEAITVMLEFNGTAQGGGVDYVISAETLTFPAGSVSESVTLSVVDDGPTDEPEETFTITVADDSTYNLLEGLTVTIHAEGLPELTTHEIDPGAGLITAVSISASATLDDPGSSAVTEAGFCWSTDPTPTRDDNDVPAGIQDSIQADITGLVPGMTYYIRAYAINGSGLAYGNSITARTLGASLLGSPWSDPSSWSTGEVPGSEDDVYLGLNADLGDMDILIDETVSIASLTLADTFQGTLTLNQGQALTLGTYVQDGGIVDFSNGTVTINGDFILGGGLFTAPFLTLAMEGDFIHSGGTFNANNGTVIMNGIDQTLTGNTVFYSLYKTTSVADTLTLGSDAVVRVTGSLILEGASEEDKLTLSCSGNPASLIIEQDTQIEHLTSGDCVKWIFQASGEDEDSTLPVAVLTHAPPTESRSLSYAVRVGGLGVSHYRYNLDGLGWNGAFTVDTPITFTLTDEGIHTLTVLGRDSDGTWQSADAPTRISWLVDTTAPVARVSGYPGGIVGPGDLALFVRGEHESITLYRFSVDGSDFSLPVPASSPILLSGLPEGEHTLTVIGSDRVGNWQATAEATEHTWTVESQAPAITLVGLPGDPTADDQATITVAGEDLTGYAYRVDGGTFLEAAPDEDIVLTDLADGRHTLEVCGLTGNEIFDGDPDGALSASWTVDTLASHAPVLTAGPGYPATLSVELTWTWSSDDPDETLSRYQVFMSAAAITDAGLAQAEELMYDRVPAGQGAVERFTVTGLSPSTSYHFAVRTVDRAGNVSALSNGIQVTTASDVPVVSSVTLTGGGTSADNGQDQALVITGSHFTGIPGGDLIRFENGIHAFTIASTSGSDTRLLATLPAGAPAGTYDIRVLNTQGRSPALEAAFTIVRTASGMPVVTFLSPSMVALGQTVNLTITGEHFSDPVTSVEFALNDETILSPEAITRASAQRLVVSLSIPADAPEGSYTVVVRNANGLANGISAMNLKVVAAEDLETSGGPVTTSGLISVTHGQVPVDLTLTTDNRIDAEVHGTYPLSVTVHIPAGSMIQEQGDGSWSLFSGLIAAPVQVFLADTVSAQLGNHGAQFTLGADNPVRLAGENPIRITLDVTVPDAAPVPSLYVVGDDGSVSLAGISGSTDDVDYVLGGTILAVREDFPEDGMVTYTLGVMLDQVDTTYALGGHVQGVSKDFDSCFIASGTHTALIWEQLLPLALLTALMAVTGLDRQKLIIILLTGLILTALSIYKAYGEETKTAWYILAGAGYQQINAENNAKLFGVDQALSVDSNLYPVIRAGYHLSDRFTLEAGFRYDMMSGAMESAQDQGEASMKGYTLLFGTTYRLVQRHIPLIGRVQPFITGDIGFRSVDSGLAYAIDSYDPALGFEVALGLDKGPFDLRLGYAGYSLKGKSSVPGFEPEGSSSDLDLSGLFAELTYRFSLGGKTVSTPPPTRADRDGDRDGVPDSYDLCPDTGQWIQVNSNGCPFDDDHDGVYNGKDMCPDSPEGVSVNERGCPMDSDWDGVYDENDQCPDTPQGMTVNKIGCSMDSDGDGVGDSRDACPFTPKGTAVNRHGCARRIADEDGDGVADTFDICPATPPGVHVEANGCPADRDEDGVPDNLDKCLDTPLGANVDDRGCWLLKGVSFDPSSSRLKAAMRSQLLGVVTILNINPRMTLEIQGHTDNQGDARQNRILSTRRAEAIRDYLIAQDIAPSRLKARGYGESNPIASNRTAEGRAKNRRVEFMPLYD